MIYFGKVPQGNILGCDLETQGLDPFRGEILSVAFSDGKNAWVWFNGIHDLSKLTYILEDESVLKIMHNAKFDMKWLQHHLGIYCQNVWDTLETERLFTAGKLQHEIPPNGYADLVARYCGVYLTKDTREEFIGHPLFSIVPVTNEQLRYIVDDVVYFPDIQNKQKEKAFVQDLLPTVELENACEGATVELELGGFTLDVDLWYEQLAEFKRLEQEADTRLREMVGEEFTLKVAGTSAGETVIREYKTEETKRTTTEKRIFKAEEYKAGWGLPKRKVNPYIRKALFHEIVFNGKDEENIQQGDTWIITRKLEDPIPAINMGSPTQLTPLLNERFLRKANMPLVTSTRSAIMESLAHVGGEVGEFAKQVLKLRHCQKRIGFDYPKHIHPITGKIHPEFRQTGTETGRYSCRNPNMQQVTKPEEGEPNMRHLFGGDTPDYVILRCDYGQQEPRIMAQLSGDPAMLAACNADDVYLMFGKDIFGHEIEKGSKERFIAKTAVLATTYKSSAETIASANDLPLDTCIEVRDKIIKAYPIAASFGNRMERQIAQYGYITSAIGRRRYINRDAFYGTIAANSPVQSTAADMFKLALSRTHKFLTEHRKSGKIDSNTRIWHIVHDEICLHVHKDDVDFISPHIIRIMEEAGREICPDVKHIAELGIGPTWDK